MIRKQKSKILLFLLMLGLLYGCKRQLLDPLNPQTQLPPKVKLDKIKGFYENGRYKNQPKRSSRNGNERMTAADSARFKDFEPQWDKTVVELLPNNEKILIVPVVRFLNVKYNQSIGFIRRLCIRVDANDDFLEANIVELVGNLTFVKNHYNTIFKNYKNTTITGFSGYVVVYEIDYDVIIAKEYENNTLKVTPCSSFPVYNDNGLYAIVDNCNGIITIIGTDGGEDTGGGDDGSGTPPASGGGTYNPPVPVPPCKGSTCPKDEGVSWLEETPVTPEEKALLESLDSLSAGLTPADKVGEMGVEDRIKLARTLRELRNSSPAYEKMYQRLKAEARLVYPHRRSLVFKILSVGHPAKGSFELEDINSPDLNTISIKATSLRDASTVAEEFLHALDTMVIRKNDPDVFNPNRVNYEFNAKVAMMMIARRDDGPEPHSLWQNYDVNGNIINPTAEDPSNEDLMNMWLNSLAPSDNPFSSLFTNQFTFYDLTRYIDFARAFKNRQQPRYGFPAQPNSEQPKLLFFLLRP